MRKELFVTIIIGIILIVITVILKFVLSIDKLPLVTTEKINV